MFSKRGKDQAQFLAQRKAQVFEIMPFLEPLAKKLEELVENTIFVPREESIQSVESLLENGVFLNRPSDELYDGIPGQCHSNSAQFYLFGAIKSKDRVYRIATGYCLNEDDGLWRQHSWLVYQNIDEFDESDIKKWKIKETTTKRMAYYGLILDEKYSKNFAMAEL